MDNASHPSPANSCPSLEEFQQLQAELHALRARLETSENRHRQVLETLPQIIWFADAQGRKCSFNARWFDYTGIGVAELSLESLNLAFLETVHPDDRDRVQAQWQQAVQRGEKCEIEYRLRSADQTYHWFIEQAQPILGESGQVLEWMGSCTHIDHRKQVEAALAEEQDFLQALLASLSEGIVACNAEGQLTLFNNATQIFHGLPAEPISAEQWASHYSLYLPDGKTPMQSDQVPLFRALQGEQVCNVEMMIVPKQGIARTLLASGNAIINQKGDKLGAVVAMRDITDRKQAEAAICQLNLELEQRVQERTAQLEAANRAKDELLVRSQRARAAAEAAEQRFRELVDGLTHAIVWERNAHTLEFTFISQSAAAILQYPLQCWLAHPDFWMNVIHPDDQARVAAFYREEAVQGQDAEVEYGCCAADGQLVWVRDRVYGVRDSAGKVQKLRGLMVDVTAQKQAEEALKTRAEELTRTTTVLAQTATILEKRNQELDQFAYVTSHDLKAPLRAIANLSQWIEEDLEDKLTPEMQRQMNLLRGRVHRMEALIDGILQYARVGRTIVKTEIVEVETLLQEVIDSLAPPSQFAIAIAPAMPILLTERTPLAQIFSNLISNAIKHHHRKAGQITIEATDQGNYYEFGVLDDGPGISPRYHDKIFGIFQTLEPRDKLESTGIGLAMVKKIVEAKGGTIRVESQAGQGASFYFTWPKHLPQPPLS